MADIERELGWDDQIEKESPDFILLPDGDYDFEVINFERARHPGSDKLPPCNKAVVHIRIDTPEGSTTIKNNFFLHTSVEGLICAFFTSIGLRQKGEPFVMRWPEVIGTRGRCKVGTREYDGKKYNQITRFLEPEGAKFQAGRF